MLHLKMHVAPGFGLQQPLPHLTRSAVVIQHLKAIAHISKGLRAMPFPLLIFAASIWQTI